MKKRQRELFQDKRFRAIIHFNKDTSQSQVARILGVSRQSVNTWYRKFKKEGPLFFVSVRASGRPVKLSMQTLMKTLSEVLKSDATIYGYSTKKWTTEKIQKIIQYQFKVKYHRDHVRKLLHKLNLKWKKQ